MAKIIHVLRGYRDAVERLTRKQEFERVFHFRPHETSITGPTAESLVRIKLRFLGREWCEAWDFLYEAILVKSEAEFGRRQEHKKAMGRFRTALRLANLFGFREVASQEVNLSVSAISLEPVTRKRFLLSVTARGLE